MVRIEGKVARVDQHPESGCITRHVTERGDELAGELFSAAKGEGKAIQTKENTHRMADANKAFAHFAW